MSPTVLYEGFLVTGLKRLELICQLVLPVINDLKLDQKHQQPKANEPSKQKWFAKFTLPIEGGIK